MNRIVILITVLTACPILYAQDIDFEGYGAAGLKFFNREILNGTNNLYYYEGKFQAEIEYNDEIEAQLDFRGNATDNAVDFREFSVKFEYLELMEVKVGHIKKPFSYEYYVTSREKLYPIERSYAYERLSELGYGGRGMALSAYYEFDDDRPDFPFSYNITAFRDNFLYSGTVLRAGYHFDDDLAAALTWQYQTRGGENRITTNGYMADISFKKKEIFLMMEGALVKDPVEGIIRRFQNRDENVYSAAAKFIAAYKFELGKGFIEDIEPVLLGSYFQPDTETGGEHVLQTVLGVNLYLDKDVLIRLNGDARLTTLRYSDEYNTDESRLVLELMVKY